MKPLIIPEEELLSAVLTWPDVPADAESPVVVRQYPIRKYFLEHEVTPELWADQTAAQELLKAGHDRALERKGYARVNDIVLKHFPPGDPAPFSRRETSEPGNRFVLTVSRAIEAKLELP